MKIILIILGILTALALFGLLFPAIIAAVIAWILFSSGHIGWGIACVIIGLIAEISYIMGVIFDSDDQFYDDGRRTGISWPQTFTAFYIINHFLNKDD